MLSTRVSKIMDEGIVKSGLVLYLNYRNGYDTVNQRWNNLISDGTPSYLTNGGSPPLVSNGVSFNGITQYSSLASNLFGGKKDYSIDVFLYPPLNTSVENVAFSYYYSSYLIKIGCNSSGKPYATCMIANTFYFINSPTTIEKEALITFTIGSTGMKLYVDGKLVASNPKASVIIPGCNRIAVGVYQTTVTSRDLYYNGVISLVRVYDRELSEGEVIQNCSVSTAIGL